MCGCMGSIVTFQLVLTDTTSKSPRHFVEDTGQQEGKSRELKIRLFFSPEDMSKRKTSESALALTTLRHAPAQVVRDRCL